MAKEKQCGKCREIKSTALFGCSKDTEDGLRWECKKCATRYATEWANKNKKKANENRKKWREKNKDKIRESLKKSSKKHAEKRKITQAAWNKRNIEKVREYKRKWEIKNPEKIRACFLNNIEKRRETRRKIAARVRGTISGKLNQNLSTSIGCSLKGNKNGRHWETIVGYTLEKLKKHLEKQFRGGMNWENYGKYGWHIDHKTPISAFNFEKPEDDDFKRCWDLNNLQPLWASDNIRKSNNLNFPFQPTIIFNQGGNT